MTRHNAYSVGSTLLHFFTRSFNSIMSLHINIILRLHIIILSINLFDLKSSH
jgi:hypothetical protein